MEKDQDVDSILINVFCGQLPADKIAAVIHDNRLKNYISKPIVCRIKGHNADSATKRLNDMNDPLIITEQDLQASCLKVMKMGKEARQ